MLMLDFKDVTNQEHLISLEQPKYKRGMNPHSRKNLLGPRWKKGESGNPQGTSLSADLKRALDKPLEEPSEDAPARELLIYSTLEGAIKREPTPFKEVWDRVDGKLSEQRTGDSGVEVRVQNFVFILPDGTKMAPKELMNGHSD